MSDKNKNEKKIKNKHIDFHAIERYLLNKQYPAYVNDKGEKANFRRACKSFNVNENGILMKSTRFFYKKPVYKKLGLF